MREIDWLTRLYGVPKRESLLELDFYAEHGTAPALRKPNPFFRVGATKDYLEGDRLAEPDWFLKGSDAYQINIKSFLTGLRDHYQRMTSNHALVIVRYPTGTSSIYRIMIDCTQGANKFIFSDAALESFSQVMRDNDDGSLDQVYTPAFARAIREYRDNCRSSGYDSSDAAETADMVRRARAFLNSGIWKAEYDGSSSEEEEEDDYDDYDDDP